MALEDLTVRGTPEVLKVLIRGDLDPQGDLLSLVAPTVHSLYEDLNRQGFSYEKTSYPLLRPQGYFTSNRVTYSIFLFFYFELKHFYPN